MRRCVTVLAAAGGAQNGGKSSSGSFSDKARNSFNASKNVMGWYPVKGGEFIGNALAGHNMFIQDIPKKFDKHHARHFSLVEALTITPTFTLSMVHYFSLYCQYPSRSTQSLPALFTELTKKSAAQKEWLAVLQQKSPTDVILWKAALLFSQLALFPLWLLVSSAAPQLVHATLDHTNHILHTKYECISVNAPAFVSANAAQCKLASDFHRSQISLPTDYAVAAVMLLLVIYITS